MRRIICIVLVCLLSLVLFPTITIQAQTRGLNWYVEYFSNKNLEGTPVLTRTMPVINNYWATSSPAVFLPANNYSGRWTATGSFQAGIYRFTLAGNDGLRLFVDNALVIDQWRDQPFAAYSTDIPLSAGSHTLRIEHYDSTNLAVIQFRFAQITGGGAGTPQLAAYGTQAKLVAFLRLRLGPGIGYGYIHVLDWGTIVNVLGKTANGVWLRVSTGDKEGWIATAYTRLVAGSLDAVPIWTTP